METITDKDYPPVQDIKAMLLEIAPALADLEWWDDNIVQYQDEDRSIKAIADRGNIINSYMRQIGDQLYAFYRGQQ